MLLLCSLAAVVWLAACAVPQAPTGGPRDETPPRLDEAEPAMGAVNVAADAIRLTFSEYVDPSSFSRAVTLNPAFDEPLRFDWSRRTVEIEFPEPLRDTTTYILTIDANLRDVNGVALDQPLTLAFSTGPVINQGRLAGRVVDPGTGAGAAGIDVYAYAAPDSAAPRALPERPDYRTQTDQSGEFAFEYLREQPYFVVALQDANRNRQPDPNEPFGVPPRPVYRADSVETTARAARQDRWYTTVLDTLPPEVDRARALSSRRLRLRLSERVRLTAPQAEGWRLVDSLRGEPAAIRTLYQMPEDRRALYLLTDSLRADPYVLFTGTLADSSGNVLRPDTLRITPRAEADTFQTRFLAFVPESDTTDTAGAHVLDPGTLPGVRLSHPVTEAGQRAFALEDTTGQPRAFALTTPDGTTYRLVPDPALQPGEAVRAVVDGSVLGGADTLYTRTFRRISTRELGDLSGVIALDETMVGDPPASDTGATIVVEVYPADTGPEETPLPARVAEADDDGRFLIGGLPGGTYRIRAFLDRNANQTWDGGRLVPYRRAEPLVWLDGEQRVRPRWETALEDTLSLPPS